MGLLTLMGASPCLDMDSADIIVLNTCAVRENAENRLYGKLGELKRIKSEKPHAVIAVCGCMAQEAHTPETIRRSYPFVDIIFGTYAADELPRLMLDVLERRTRAEDTAVREMYIPRDVPLVRNSTFKAGVSIMYGCNNFCTFCVVPLVRGRERSRDPADVIEEVKSLAESGYKEIMLLGQNVNSYGRYVPEGEKIGFAELLRRIDAIDGDFRVRFMSPHPKDMTNEVLDVIAESRKLCRCIHLPLQSGSDRILKAMHRGYTVEKFMDIVSYGRKVMPGLSVTTDIIVGFPGEEYDDFRGTLDVMKSAVFDNIYSFIYSPRKGTRAASLPDPVPAEEKSLWMRELLTLQREISQNAYERFVGKEFEVLFDGEHGGRQSGKSDEGIITLADTPDDLCGQMRRVKVTKAHNWAVEGTLVL